jgi:hypothetical protein
MMKQPLLIIAFVSFFITGCTVIPANKTANIKAHNVYLTQKKPPKSCRYVGEVYGSQGNWFTGMFTSNMDLALGARNSLKNQAAHIHANYVYIEAFNANDSALIVAGNKNVTLVGQAYACENLKGYGVNAVTETPCGYLSFCVKRKE